MVPEGQKVRTDGQTHGMDGCTDGGCQSYNPQTLSGDNNMSQHMRFWYLSNFSSNNGSGESAHQPEHLLHAYTKHGYR